MQIFRSWFSVISSGCTIWTNARENSWKNLLWWGRIVCYNFNGSIGNIIRVAAYRHRSAISPAEVWVCTCFWSSGSGPQIERLWSGWSHSRRVFPLQGQHLPVSTNTTEHKTLMDLSWKSNSISKSWFLSHETTVCVWFQPTIGFAYFFPNFHLFWLSWELAR